MKRSIASILLTLTVLFSGIAGAQDDPVIARIIEIGRTDNRVMEHMDYVCNRIGGRITGSDNYMNACLWAMETFREWGLEAELDKVGEVAVGFNRGPWFGKMTAPEEKALFFGTPSYSAGTKGVQRGHVVIAPKSDDELRKKWNQLNNAWILLPDTSSGWARGGRSGIDPPVIAEYEKAGALGTIMYAPEPLRLLEDKVPSWEWLPTLPDIKLTGEQYTEIYDRISRGERVELEFDIRNHFKRGPIPYHNVVAWIPGTTYPDEFVILGGHLDSFDGATGGVDNASGFTPAMEAVRILMAAGARPKRSIMVHLWAAEERGLVGSQSWVKRHPDLLPNISALFNRDNGTNAITGLRVSEAMFPYFDVIAGPVRTLNPDYPFTLSIQDVRAVPTRAGGSDHSSFLMAGVPAMSWRTQGRANYGRTWHTAYDTYDAVIPEYQEHSAIVIALIAYGVANLDEQLPRDGYFYEDGIYAEINTNRGRIAAKLFPEKAPVTVANFVGLAEGAIMNDALPAGTPFYDGSVWHRVVQGHVIQAGMPKNGRTRGPGYTIPNEIDLSVSHDKAGMLGMANSGPHTNSSQFYITLGDRSYLDGNYTVFGEVVSGMRFLDQIAQGDSIRSIVIRRFGEEAQNFRPETRSFRMNVEDAKTAVERAEKEKEREENEIIEEKWPGAAEGPAGIHYIVRKEGTGNTPAEGAVLTVRYTGMFLNGVEFAGTSDRGRPDYGETAEQFEYTVGESRINPGIDAMLRDMKAGEKRTVILPAGQAYGAGGFYARQVEGKKRFVIPPHARLVYEIELLAVK